MRISKINKSSFIDSGIRLDASFHLSDAQVILLKLKQSTLKKVGLKNLTKDIFKGNIFKRTYVNNIENGYEFISASDMMKLEVKSEKILSKKYTNVENLKVDKNWILVSRSGTLGNTTFTNEDFKNFVLSDDLIRILPDDEKILSGYMYAYLTSKFGYNLLTQSGYGGVIQHIEPHHLYDLPVPIIAEHKQQEIHNLITESSNLRVEANKLLKEAIVLFESQLNERKVKLGFQFGSISAIEIFSKQKRFDSQYQILWKSIKNEYTSIKYQKIGELAKSIYVGGRGKRNYVDNGVPFLSSSDMMLFNPVRNSKKVGFNTPGLKSMKVDKFDILISRSGTVGNTIIVGDSLKNVAVSEHALRLKINSEALSPSYVFAFLNTNIGKRAMEASAFGSVIITLNEELIGDIDIPILEKSIQNNISMKVEKYIESIDKATIKENQAIDLIEKEIDAWQ